MNELLKKIATWAFGAVVLISIAAMFGWLTNKLSWSGMGKNSIPMAPVTFICFIITSLISLFTLYNRIYKTILKCSLILVLIICLIILIDSLTGYSLKFEHILTSSPGTFQNLPLGLMSPVTSILFLLSTFSLLLFATKKSLKSASVLSTVVFSIAFTFDLGYLYGNPLLYGHHIIPPSWTTSLSFTLLSVGILFGFGMNEIPMKFFTGNSTSNRLMKFFLPVSLLIIILSGWFDAIIFKSIPEKILSTALVTIISLVILGFILMKLARKLGNDIDNLFSSRKEAEEALRESELHFRTLADSGQALIWTSGLDKKCNYFNQPWLSFTGRSLAQELGDGWIEGVHPDDLQHCLETYITAFNQRERFNMDYRMRYNDGTYRWIQDNGTPRYNVRGEFIGYIGHCLDITDRKLAEEALAKSEERYRLISSVATDYTFSTRVLPDGSLDLEWTAGAFESISGYSFDDYKKKGAWRATLHPDDVYIDDIDIARLRNNEDTESQLRTIDRNGKIIWVQVFAHPVWDYEKNCLKGIYGAVKNINDRKRAEEKLINSEKRFRELLEKVNLIAIILDNEGIIIFCNDFLLQLTGYTSEELIGGNWFDLMIPKENIEAKEIFINGLSDGFIKPRFENPIMTKSGKKLDIVWSNMIQRKSTGEMTGVASIGEDITERKLAEEKIRLLNEELEQRVADRTMELEKRSKELMENETTLLKLVNDLNIKSTELLQNKEQLEAANKELEAFSYSVSHDLRAPLRAINGFVNILLEEYEQKLDDEGKRICNIIQLNAIKMGQLIDDLLSFSRLIRSEMHQSEIDMEKMVNNIISEITTTLDCSNKTFTINELAQTTGDTNLIKQVWINLINNAIKYSSKKEHPQITIGSYPDKNEIVYYIKDNGVGFNMSYAHKLFGVFQRLHSSTDFEGTGVGLAIVQRIINRHHGRVWAEGEVDVGSTFYFSMPIDR